MGAEAVEVFELLVDENTLPKHGEQVLLFDKEGNSSLGSYDKGKMAFKIDEKRNIALFDVAFWKHV